MGTREVTGGVIRRPIRGGRLGGGKPGGCHHRLISIGPQGQKAEKNGYIIFEDVLALERGAEVLFPQLLCLCADNEGVAPDIGETGEAVAAGIPTSELGTGVDDFATLGALHPAADEIIEELFVGEIFGKELALGVGRRDLAVMTVEGAEVKLAGRVNQVGPREAVLAIGRVEVLDHAEVGEIPAKADGLARCLLVERGNLIDFFRRLGAGVAMDFEIDVEAHLFGELLDLEPDGDGFLRRRVMVAGLDVDARGTNGLGGLEAVFVGLRVGVDVADVVGEAVLVGEFAALQVWRPTNCIKAGFFRRLELLIQRPFLLGRRVAAQGPKINELLENRRSFFHEEVWIGLRGF